MGNTNRVGGALTLFVAAAAAMGLAAILASIASVNDETLNYWIAVLSGNWSARQLGDGVAFPAVWWHWLGVVLALSMNFASLGLLIKLVLNFSVAKRRHDMKLMQAFDVLQADIESAILNRLSEREVEGLESEIKAAFEEGAKIWREQSLVTMLGKRGAEKLLADLEASRLEEVE